MDIIGDATDFQSNVVNTPNNQVSHQEEVKLENKMRPNYRQEPTSTEKR
jgi:hypothetical protein